MKKTNFSESQIISILRSQEFGRIVNDINREVLTIAVDSSLPSGRVIRELDKLIEWRGKPDIIRSDNGPEFISDKIALWCSAHQIEWEFTQSGKPTQNSLIERFNRTFRQDE